jgi:hypothetical protein
MIAICTICRQPNGVACPHCGHRATEIYPTTTSPRGNTITALFTCNRPTCPRNKKPFHKEEGGITHRRHQSCPPTNRLELLQSDEGGQPLTPEDRANLIASCTPTPKEAEGPDSIGTRTSEDPSDFGIVATADEILSDLGISPDQQERWREEEEKKGSHEGPKGAPQ